MKVLNVVPQDVKLWQIRQMKRRLWNPEEERIVAGAGKAVSGRYINYYQLWNRHPVLFVGLSAVVLLYAVRRARNMVRMARQVLGRK
jgi:hypothetical protein